jgi:hypothetical protein
MRNQGRHFILINEIQHISSAIGTGLTHKFILILKIIGHLKSTAYI